MAHHVTLADTISVARESLLAGRTLAAIRCPHCAELHLDTGSFAVRKHVTHLCCVPDCGRWFTYRPAVQGNPLAVFSPVLRDSRLLLARLPTQADMVTQSARL